MTGWGPRLFGNNPSQCGSSAFSSADTLAVMSLLLFFIKAIAIIIILLLLCYCHCRGSNFRIQSTLLYFGVPKHTESNIIARTR